MGNNRKPGPGPPACDNAKDRHNKDRKWRSTIDWTVPAPADLVAKPEKPKANPKHKYQSYLEWVENADKKKKLEFQVTADTQPPPGFEFVPVGNPQLTTACKELSREKEAMMFIVAIDSRTGLTHREDMVQELGRIGFHFRQTIVDAARDALGLATDCYVSGHSNVPEPIPQTQEEINQQADAAIRDLFPRIPHTDRQAVVDRAFKINDNKVGTFSKLNLSKRVQLAVLAHIRHNYTRYDQLLRETNWENARKAVETLCLDYLVKWRGDEENGRDQLDEVLREVIVISDSDSNSDSDDADDSDGSSSLDSQEFAMDEARSESIKNAQPTGAVPRAARERSRSLAQMANQSLEGTRRASRASNAGLKGKRVKKKHTKRLRTLRRSAKPGPKKEANAASRGFKRYQAVRDQAWHEAVERQRLAPQPPSAAIGVGAMDQRSPDGAADTWSDLRRSIPHQVYGVTPDARLPAQGGQGYDNVSVSQPVPKDNHIQFGLPPSAPAPRIGYPVSAATHTYPEGVGHRGEVLRDLLVKSIEPSSPGNGHSARIFAQRNITPTDTRPHSIPLTSRVSIQRSPDPYDRGFIQLPPRESRIYRDSRYQPDGIRTYAPRDEGSGLAPRHVAVENNNTPLVRPEPARVYSDTAGSEFNPIVIGSSPQHTSYANSHGRGYPHPMPSGPHRRTRIAEVIDLRTRNSASPGPQRRENLIDSQNLRFDTFGDVTAGSSSEIVRVANKFPRQYEPHPAPISTPRYDLRSGYRPTAEQAFDKIERSQHWKERIYSSAQRLRDPGGPSHRHERVVAVEYIPVEPRNPAYRAGDSAAPYRGPSPQRRPPAHPLPAEPRGPAAFHSRPASNFYPTSEQGGGRR